MKDGIKCAYCLTDFNKGVCYVCFETELAELQRQIDFLAKKVAILEANRVAMEVVRTH